MEFDDILELAVRIGQLSWHLEILFPGKNIIDLITVFKSIKIPISIAHLAYQAVIAGIAAPGFQT